MPTIAGESDHELRSDESGERGIPQIPKTAGVKLEVPCDANGSRLSPKPQPGLASAKHTFKPSSFQGLRHPLEVLSDEAVGRRGATYRGWTHKAY